MIVNTITTTCMELNKKNQISVPITKNERHRKSIVQDNHQQMDTKRHITPTMEKGKYVFNSITNVNRSRNSNPHDKQVFTLQKQFK